ncbi:MAG TPA: hypothetical protein VJS15_10165 [Allosphingosinicella sp.]|nr:hypothetical protein [Allosphingosinicella sp.]
MRIDVKLEERPPTVVIRPRNAAYARKSASEFADEPARLTDRQALFLRNLIQLAGALGSNRIPVDFELLGRGPMYLDRGCIKIAEHAGFIAPLSDDPDGVVSQIELAWDATGNRRSPH